MRTRLVVILVLGACLGLAAGAPAAPLIFEENFGYTTGSLLTANGWAAHSGTGTNAIAVTASGLTYTGYPSSGIGNAVAMTTSGEDDNHTFTPQTSGSVYYSAMVRVSAAQNTGDYFIHFGLNPTGTSGFHGKVWCRNASGGVNFGVSRVGTGTSVVWSSTVFPLNTTHLIVIKYTFVAGTTNDTVNLFVNPNSCPGEPTPLVSSGAETAADAASIGSIILRQGTASAASTQWVDGIRVGTTWADVVCGAAATGACCAADGSCSVLTLANCTAAGGAYQGNGTGCSPNPCPQPGTCCVGTACTFVLQASCAGIWTPGGGCSPNPCTEPIGSCCAHDATCTVTTQATCTETWTLDGVCVPNTCPPPTGSCCSPEGACTVTLEADCTDNWTVDGVCSPNTCPILTGACCLPDETCTEGTASACAASGGVYEGNFTSCSPNPCVAPPPSERLKIVHIDCGQGDGAVLISPGGQVVLFDTQKAGTGVMGVTMLAQLQALGITHVDYNFQSHYHVDHLSNIDEIVNGGIAIDRGYDRGTANEPSTAGYNTYVSTLGAHRRTMVKNQVVTLDSLSAHPVTIKCVTPNGEGISIADENYMSMVLKVSYGEFGMVFGGDLQSGSGVDATVGPMVGEVEVYKVHHHGSANATSPAWLAATQPKVGVISVGSNSYGHPTATALSNLHNAGVHTYWTETGSGASPNPSWDKVSNGQVIISATWQPAGVDTIRGNGFVDTFINSGTPSDLTPPVVTVYAPNGGETWTVGSANNITWTANDNVGVTSIDIDYSTNSGASWTSVATGLANSGTYAWTVPNTPSVQAKVKVTAHDAATNSGSDVSNAVFTIALPPHTIVASAGPGGSISPTGNVVVNDGASQSFSITPDPCYSISNVLVDGNPVGAVPEYLFSNVTTDHTISASFAIQAFTLATSVTGSGSLSIVPDLPSYNCGASVEISAQAGAGCQFDHWTGSATGSTNPLTVIMNGDKSINAVFVDVTPPSVTLTSPNGGEFWIDGESQAIAWTATDNVGVTAIDLAYSTDGGATYPNSIATGLANTGSYPWTVPSVASSTVRVRVTAHDAAGLSTADDSDADFEINVPVNSVADALLGPGEVLGVYPNPAHAGAARVLFRIPEATSLNVSIYDVTGHMVRRIASGAFPSGVRAVAWDGREEDGGQAPAGIYLVRLTADSGIRQTKRLVLFR